MVDLRDESFIMMPAENSLFRLTEAICREEGFIPRKSILCDDPFCVRKYISAGLGISLIPPGSWANLWEENIVLKPILNRSVMRTTYLECRRADLEKPHIRRFIDFCLQTAAQKT